MYGSNCISKRGFWVVMALIALTIWGGMLLEML